MIELGDIINLIWVDGDKPIHIIAEGGTPEHRASTIAEELESSVLGINIYEDRVEIALGE